MKCYYCPCILILFLLLVLIWFWKSSSSYLKDDKSSITIMSRSIQGMDGVPQTLASFCTYCIWLCWGLPYIHHYHLIVEIECADNCISSLQMTINYMRGQKNNFFMQRYGFSSAVVTCFSFLFFITSNILFPCKSCNSICEHCLPFSKYLHKKISKLKIVI